MTEIERLINTIAGEYGIPGWVARGIAYGESGLDPNAAYTEPDGRSSYGLYQIHDIHGLSREWRLNPENNIRWAMENSVVVYHNIEHMQWSRAWVLAYVWRHGQRCAEWAIEPAVKRALAYLDRYDEENKEEPMSTEARDETVALLDEAMLRIDMAKETILEAWPVGPPPVPLGKTTNLVLVTYHNQPPWNDYLTALMDVPKQIDDWLKPQGLKVNAWCVEHVALVKSPGSYNLLSIVKAVQEALGEAIPNEDNALYIFSQDPDGEKVLYGTLGGDWFDGPQFPGVSYFMIPGLHALAYDTDHPTVGADEGWTRNRALGAIAHELGHNLCGLRCADYPHAPECIMRNWAQFRNCVYETSGYTFQSVKPNPVQYNEREALIDSGFMRRV